VRLAAEREVERPRRVQLAQDAKRYSHGMKDPKRATVYFDPKVHRALSRKAAASNRSISHVVNEAVRMALAEDAEDIKAIRERVSEKNLDTNDTSRLAI